MEEKKYNTLIVTTEQDFLRSKSNYQRLVENMPSEQLIFVGSEGVGRQTELMWRGKERVSFINEEEIIPFGRVHSAMQRALSREDVPRGVTGWYYQQFLKMQYSALCQEEYYMVWDGDTIPCKPFSMFSETGIPYLDVKHEYHEEYFVTLEKLFPGMHKCIEASFISEHMLMKKEIMQSLIKDIMNNGQLCGESFYERIINCIEPEKLTSNSFSEFETYGTYTCFKFLGSYRPRSWHSFRYAGYFLHPEQLTDEDYEWLGRDFDALSFEKGNTVREDFENLFNNKEYQAKLSARQMLEIAQEEFKEGYREMW